MNQVLCVRKLHVGWEFSWRPLYTPELQQAGWYTIDHDPIGLNEYLEYDEKNDCIVIKIREMGAEELEAERQMAIKRQLVAELPDIILQNKDNPEALVQALCDRAKQIEVENETRRNPEAV